MIWNLRPIDRIIASLRGADASCSLAAFGHRAEAVDAHGVSSSVGESCMSVAFRGFGPDPRIHHLFDPRTGRSANHYLSVSVTAPRATLADGLSTALSVTPPEAAEALLAGYPSARAFLLDADGRLHTVTAIT